MKPDFLIVPFGLSIQLIFLFKRDWLIDKKIEKWIWAGTTTLFIVGYLLAVNYTNEIKTLPLLMVPLMSYSIFRLLLTIYRMMFKTDPVDTFYSMDLKLMKSGVFNSIFWLLGLILPIIVAFEMIK